MAKDGSNRAERTQISQRVSALERAADSEGSPFRKRDVSFLVLALVVGYIANFFLQPKTPWQALAVMAVLFLSLLYPIHHFVAWQTFRSNWSRNVQWLRFASYIFVAAGIVGTFGYLKLWPSITMISPRRISVDSVPNSKVTFRLTNRSDDTQYEASFKVTVIGKAQPADFNFVVSASTATPIFVKGGAMDDLFGAECRDSDGHLFFFFKQPELAPHQSKELVITHRTGTALLLTAETMFSSTVGTSFAVNESESQPGATTRDIEIDRKWREDIKKYGCFAGLTFDDPFKDQQKSRQ